MCGLVAILSLGAGPPVAQEELDRRTDSLAHRGPDDRGTWISPDRRVGLGHRRLSILDLSPAGRQPLTNEDGSLRLAFNGEIYNFRELRRQLIARGHRFSSHTDSEVIVHAWEEWREDALQRLEGMFAFALWDEGARRLLVARDRLGIKPLVWSAAGGRFTCASELAGLFAAEPAPQRTLDRSSLDGFLALGAVPGPGTIWRGVQRLSPGCWLSVDPAGRVEERCWWDLAAGAAAAIDDSPAEEIVDRAEETLRRAVHSHLVADVPVGAFLSGGIDSSLVCALAARELGEPLRTFSVAFPGRADEDESRWARRVAERLGTVHRELVLEPDVAGLLPRLAAHAGEPFAVASVLGVHLLAREAAREVKVVLTGDGGDEVFAGYPRRHGGVDTQADRLATLPLARLRGAQAGPRRTQRIRWEREGALAGLVRRARLARLPDEPLRRRRYADELQVFNEAERHRLYDPGWRVAGTGPDTEDRLAPRLRPFPHRLQRWLYLDLKTSLADEMLTKVDLATMAVGLEARVPLLDHRLVELAFRSPERLMLGKGVLRAVAARHLPPEVVHRPKHGFTLPLTAWILGPLRAQAELACRDAALTRLGVLDSLTLEGVWTSFLTRPTAQVASQVFTLTWLDQWARTARPSG